MINFNVPAIVGKEGECVEKSFSSGHLSGDGEFTRLCANWFERTFDVKNINNDFLYTCFGDGCYSLGYSTG